MNQRVRSTLKWDHDYSGTMHLQARIGLGGPFHSCAQSTKTTNGHGPLMDRLIDDKGRKARWVLLLFSYG